MIFFYVRAWGLWSLEILLLKKKIKIQRSLAPLSLMSKVSLVIFLGSGSLKITPMQPMLSFVLWAVPMIRSHKWEWGPPIPRHHPALQCPHYTMHLQTQLILRNLTGPSQLTSLLLSPYQTAPTPWTTDFAASFLNPVILFLLCRQCQGKGVLCTNARCLSQTSPSHHKALSRSTTTQSMNIPPWLAVQPAKASPLLWWSNRNPEILHMTQKCLAATPFIWGKKASWLIQAEQKLSSFYKIAYK